MKIIGSESKIIQIIEGDISDLKEIHGKMQLDFPPNEIKSYAHSKMLMENKKYKLLLAKQRGLNLNR